MNLNSLNKNYIWILISTLICKKRQNISAVFLISTNHINEKISNQKWYIILWKHIDDSLWDKIPKRSKHANIVTASQGR